MPERRTEDVIHVTMTDHRIARLPKPPKPLAALTEQAVAVDTPMHSFSWNENDNTEQTTEPLYKLFSTVKDDNEFALQPFYNELLHSKNHAAEPKILAVQKLLQYKKFEQAETIYGSLSERQKLLNIALVNAGINKLGLEQHSEAQLLLEKATEADRENPEAWYNLGVLHSRSDNSDLALECWERAIEIRPSYTKPRLKVGSRFALDDRLAEAASQFKKVLELDVRNVEAYRKLSSALRSSGDWGQAVAILRDGLKIAPDNIQLLQRAALTLLETENKVANDKEMLLSVTEKWIKVAPDSPEALILHSIALVKNNQPNESHQYLRPALLSGKRKPEAGLVLAMAQHVAGSETPALNNFDGAKNALVNQKLDRTSRVILENATQYFSNVERDPTTGKK